jgi:hypothetical protein
LNEPTGNVADNLTRSVHIMIIFKNLEFTEPKIPRLSALFMS